MDPSRQLLRSIRRWQSLEGKSGIVANIARRYWTFLHGFWQVLSGCDIGLQTQIGGGLLLPHPSGVAIHPDAIIGPNCLFMNQVTIGPDEAGRCPSIGANVYIAAGAAVMGNISVGDNSVIGLNAVVITDIPKGSIAVGVPAKAKKNPRYSEHPSKEDA